MSFLSDLHEIAESLKDIVGFLYGITHRATGFKIYQYHRVNWRIGHMGAILGIAPGATGHFSAVTSPAGSVLQAGSVPVYTADSPDVTLANSADCFSTDATVASTSTATAFNLTLTGISFDGTTIASTVSVPVLQVAPPPPVPATGFDITQTS